MGSGGEKAKVLLSFLNSLDSIALLLRAAPNQGDRKRVSVLIPEEILEAVVCFKATKLHHAFQDLDIRYWLPLLCYRPTTINSLPARSPSLSLSRSPSSLHPHLFLYFSDGPPRHFGGADRRFVSLPSISYCQSTILLYRLLLNELFRVLIFFVLVDSLILPQGLPGYFILASWSFWS
ncbi:hypothetical protein SDJN02_12973, partial [Cucurbita argyrosperma subsp. argyrosperma]